MLVTEEEFSLMHYGILRRSGRYPWGSGKDPEERGRSFLNTVDELKKSGMSESDIAKSFSTKDHPFTTTHLRALKTVALATKKQSDIYQAQRLKDKGESNVAIGKRMGINESSVRALLAPGAKDKASVLDSTTNMLRNQIAEKTHIDIGSEVERSLPLSDNPSTHIGISKQKLSTAVAVLQEEGYKVRYLKVRQLGTGQDTNLKVCLNQDLIFQKLLMLSQLLIVLKMADLHLINNQLCNRFRQNDLVLHMVKKVQKQMVLSIFVQEPKI